jgi:chorismate mutase
LGKRSDAEAAPSKSSSPAPDGAAALFPVENFPGIGEDKPKDPDPGEPGLPNEVNVKIDEVRKRIDLLDDVLLRIFNERARLALEIGHYKKERGLAVYDPAREKRIFVRMKEENPGPLDDGAVVRLFERVVDESRRLERIMSQEEGRDEC